MQAGCINDKLQVDYDILKKQFITCRNIYYFSITSIYYENSDSLTPISKIC